MALKGTVSWFNNVKGFGFISHEGGPDVFCHYTSIQTDGYKTLKEGEEVEFDVEVGSTGRAQSANVIPLKAKL